MKQTIKFLGIVLLLPFSLLAQEDTVKHHVTLETVTISATQLSLHSAFKNNKDKTQASIEELLEYMPGVSLLKRGNYAWEPTIRGLNAAQINLAIDGMAMFGACTDRMDPISSYIEPNNLENITAHYGPDANSFGSSIAGGFNFKLKQPFFDQSKKWTGRIGAGFESNGKAYQTMASLNFNQKKLAINFNGIFRHSDNYWAAKKQVIDFSQYTKWNGGMGVKYLLSDQHILSAQYLQDEGYQIGYPALTMDVDFAKAKIASFSHIYVNNTSKLDKWETKLYYNYIDHAMDDTKRPKETNPIHMDMPGQSQTFGLFSEVSMHWNALHHSFFRLDAYQNRMHSEMTMYPDKGASMFMLTIPDAQRDVIGLSVNNHALLLKKLQLEYGGRAELVHSDLYTEEGKQILTGIYSGELNRLQFNYNLFINSTVQLNKNWQIAAQVARGMRSPSLKELYGFYIFNRGDAYDYLGNPALKKEQSWNGSAMVQYHNSKIKTELKAFAYLFQDYIVGLYLDGYSVMTFNAKGVKQFDNLASAQLSGFEWNWEIDLYKGLSLHSSNSYTYGRDNEQRALPTIPPFKSVNHLSYKWKNSSFGWETILAAAQNHVNYSFYGENSSPSFVVNNLNAAHRFDLKNEQTILLNAGINNLFDTDYYEHLDLMKVPRMGRNFFIQFTYNF